MLITVLVPKETHKLFKGACVELGVSMSDVLRHAIDETILVVLDAHVEADMEKLADAQETAAVS